MPLWLAGLSGLAVISILCLRRARQTSSDLREAVKINRHILDLQAERDGLKAILTAMDEGLVVVDFQGRVLVANAAARKLLQISTDKLPGCQLSEMISQPELLANIGFSISSAQACSFEFQMPTDDLSSCHILARCAPFQQEAQRPSGAIAMLHDISDLRRLERMRTEFVANVSHELRTPLTSLLGYLETLEEGRWENKAESDKFLQICRRQAVNLHRIVDDLLRLSRLENPQQEVATSDVGLNEAIDTAVEEFRSLAESRKIKLTMEVSGESAIVKGDRGLLVQAISNLIENSINYNRENGQVHVKLSRLPRLDAINTECQWEISVADTGIGIPPGALHRIFERFYRVDKARSKDRGGTGLGLAIVKHIAIAHGASVHVVSELGKGSTFFLRFKSRACIEQNSTEV